MPTWPQLKFFVKTQHLWNPYIQSISTASTGFYLILVLRSSPFKVGGYCHNPGKYPSQLMFTAIKASTNKLPIWPYPHFYAILKLVSGNIHYSWPPGHILHHWPLWTIINPTTPGQYLISGPGGHFPFQGPLVPLAQSRALFPPLPFWGLGPKWDIWATPYSFYGPWDQLDPFWPKSNGAKGADLQPQCQVGSKPQLSTPEPNFGHNPRIPKMAKNPQNLKMAKRMQNHQIGHK
ncbi:hypothetical protein O181_006736 [Austropuccinia psidii MF-1]|uniref:Uncharacterized protein n=1 Tax=Austropuccinia psidii MF-1 TaxID=1389203 RepID=A0A9Q3GH09_9BASI|nr:hypothetical protein [Austropuccinia psidii MF-1]